MRGRAGLLLPSRLERLGWAYLALSLALLMRHGAYHRLGLALCVAALALLLSTFRQAQDEPALTPLRLLPLLLAQGALSLSRPPGVSLLPEAALTPYFVLQGAVLGLTLIGLVHRRLAGWLPAALLTLLYLCAGTLVMRDAPTPRIDVFVLHQLGGAGLLAGIDPYTMDFPNIFTPAESVPFYGFWSPHLTHYPYPPLSLLLTTAGFYLFEDARAALLAAQAGTGLLLYALAWRNLGSRQLAVGTLGLFLGHPRGLMVLEQSWTEPLVTLCYVALLLSLCPSPDEDDPGAGRHAPGVLLGLFLAVKQYSVLALPLLCLRRFVPSRRPLLVGVAVAAILTLPFSLWHVGAFVDDVLLFQLQQPFRIDALSIPALLYRLTRWKAPGALAVLGAAAAMAWGVRRTPAGYVRQHGLALVTALVYLSFFLWAKQAFTNYYYLTQVMLLVALATGRRLRAAVMNRSPNLP